MSSSLDPAQERHFVCKDYQQTTKVAAGRQRDLVPYIAILMDGSLSVEIRSPIISKLNLFMRIKLLQ